MGGLSSLFAFLKALVVPLIAIFAHKKGQEDNKKEVVIDSQKQQLKDLEQILEVERNVREADEDTLDAILSNGTERLPNGDADKS